MTTVGTALVVAKTALVSALEADATLTAAGVNVSYQAPILPADLKSTDGDYEAIWLGDASISYEIPVLTAAHLHRNETIRQQVMVQVLKPGTGTAATQSAADTRAAEILTRLADILANNVDLSVTDPARFEAVLTGANVAVGWLGNGQGHGTRFECTVEFAARLTPT